MGRRLVMASLLAAVALGATAEGAAAEALIPLDGPFSSDPVYANGQSTRSLLGKVLRIDPRLQGDGSAYGIPPSNPFAGNPRCGPGAGAMPCPEIFAYGLRNPFRASFDRLTGDFVVGDVGENTWEEVDLGRLTNKATGDNGLRGANLGWAACEGNFATGSVTAPCPLDQTPAFFAYPHAGSPAQTGCAVT